MTFSSNDIVVLVMKIFSLQVLQRDMTRRAARYNDNKESLLRARKEWLHQISGPSCRIVAIAI
jgi:hypothetical protein